MLGVPNSATSTMRLNSNSQNLDKEEAVRVRGELNVKQNI